jgi:recombination protein RecA
MTCLSRNRTRATSAQKSPAGPSGGVDVLVIDSVAALVPELNSKAKWVTLAGDSGALMSQALRKLTAVVARSNTCLIFINQIREKIA